MPPSTRRPGSFSRNRATLLTPFCRLTIDGILRRMLGDDVGHLSGIGALDRDQHEAGIGKSVEDFPTMRACWPQAFVRSRQSWSGRRPLASISAITRGRANSVTRRPPAASMPPTKQPMLPAPAMPIGSVRRSFHRLRIPARSIAEAARGAYRARCACPRRRLVTVMGHRYVFRSGAVARARRRTMGLLDILNGMQNGPRGPTSRAPNPTAAACRQ